MAVSALSLAAAPLAADAKPRQKHRVWVCDKNVKGIANTGTAAGAVAGGLLGHAIGGHTTGTLLGAGAGAYAGRRIAKGRAERNCHYEYRYR
jgi:uncharacterized protein YcfJ